MELLSPAGSALGVRAAVLNGANAVYMGGGDYNARRGAKNLGLDEMIKAVEYCRVRGVKAYITLNTILSDRELESCSEFVRELNRMGADALIIADLGVMRMARQVAPDLPLHGSTQMTVHNLDGVMELADLGFKRVVLARELSREQIEFICARSPIETEVFVHGAQCMCYSGQCYMSALIGRRSGNRGLCAQPCRLEYKFGGNPGEAPKAYLSLKDLSLATRLTELEKCGVTSLKIEGRMKRPEYVAAVTGAFANCLKEKRNATAREMLAMQAVFSRDGFSDGYFMDEIGPSMFGVRGEDAPDKESRAALETASQSYADGREIKCADVKFYFIASKGEHIKLAFEDNAGNRGVAYGETPQPAEKRDTLEDTVRTHLVKTGGTIYSVSETHVSVERGLNISASGVNSLRREALDRLTALRAEIPNHREGQYKPGYQLLNRQEKPLFTVSVLKWEQLTPEVLKISPERVYLPAGEILQNAEAARELIKSGIRLCVSPPRILNDNEKPEFEKKLDTLKDIGISGALCGNIGLFSLFKRRDMEIYGDIGLNIYNSQALKEYKRMGLDSAALSFELTLSQIRDISKSLKTEVFAYGRLPMMICENCVIKNKYRTCGYCKNQQTLTDRSGAAFPVIAEEGCRSVIYNGHKLYLADKLPDLYKLGLSYLRLAFTTENPRECGAVAAAYAGQDVYEPSSVTRGLYYRGVL